MKKTGKIIAVVLVVALAVTALAIFAACGEKYTGECHYSNQWATYGVKVDVTVKGDIVSGVRLYTDAETEWVRTSASWKENDHEGDLGFEKAEAGYANWINTKIVGQDVATILSWSADATLADQTVGASSPKLAGATQSSARIIAAVQNALEQIPGITKVVGEYSYATQWATYGAKVSVYLRDGKILAVKLHENCATDDWVRTSASWQKDQHEGDLGFAEAEAAYAGWIKSTFVGKTAAEVSTYVATRDGENYTFSGVDKLAGASQSAGRIINAVKDALSKLAA